jgi:hypothetical protein
LNHWYVNPAGLPEATYVNVTGLADDTTVQLATIDPLGKGSAKMLVLATTVALQESPEADTT